MYIFTQSTSGTEQGPMSMRVGAAAFACRGLCLQRATSLYSHGHQARELTKVNKLHRIGLRSAMDRLSGRYNTISSSLPNLNDALIFMPIGQQICSL